ncbi:GNAT family N-acetyltransferase [uncultured Cohaesibacter sp.]|uniref:GNAT family N-acetyltransferase n=1 Tax=uncultured Cohaesibacter sp. TaxID=1002546 RepID=UPI002AA83569|nr:GNAT family N-acetyltransferase [uncultured Cohaesibacter sp.]
MIELRPYFADQDKSLWDQVIEQCDNSHFMVQRDFMDYHSDRFEDASIVVLDKGKLVGALPANKSGALWASHQGLTFGGLFLLPKYNRIAVQTEIFEQLWPFLKNMGFEQAQIKPVPWIYHLNPCEGQVYCLSQATIEHHYSEITTTVDLNNRAKASSLRLRGQKKAIKAGLDIRVCAPISNPQTQADLAAFWQILSGRLLSKYERKPVHSLEEITVLMQHFPDAIRLVVAEDRHNRIIGGSLLFVTPTLHHAQYISASDEGMALGALDLLFLGLIERAEKDCKRYFDFGISTEENGTILNEKLASFKEGFGGRSVIHNKYLISL